MIAGTSMHNPARSGKYTPDNGTTPTLLHWKMRGKQVLTCPLLHCNTGVRPITFQPLKQNHTNYNTTCTVYQLTDDKQLTTLQVFQHRRLDMYAKIGNISKPQ